MMTATDWHLVRQTDAKIAAKQKERDDLEDEIQKLRAERQRYIREKMEDKE